MSFCISLVFVGVLGRGKKLNSTLNTIKKVTTALKIIFFSAGVFDALLASYDTKLVAYYSLKFLCTMNEYQSDTLSIKTRLDINRFLISMCLPTRFPLSV